jgi:hypothetical protein
MMLTADRRSVGIALLVFAIIPLGDMLIILGSSCVWHGHVLFDYRPSRSKDAAAGTLIVPFLINHANDSNTDSNEL